jgi:hypothetical protein
MDEQRAAQQQAEDLPQSFEEQMPEEENKPELVLGVAPVVVPESGPEVVPGMAVAREVHQCRRGVPDGQELELALALVGMAMPELEWVLVALVSELQELEALVEEAVEEALV